MTAVFLGVIGFVGAVLFAIIVRQSTDEFKAWTPRLTSRILELAVSKLPQEQRARMREEWAAHIDETPGEIGKWIEAAGFLSSARRTDKASLFIRTERPEQAEHTIPSTMRNGYDLDAVFLINANVNRHISIQAKALSKSFVVAHLSDAHLPRDKPTET